MDNAKQVNRSPLLMNATDTGLLVVDVQERLVPAIHNGQGVVWNVGRLLEAARVFDLPVAATEQYPRGLGNTLPELADRLHDGLVQKIPEKMTFSAAGCREAFDALRERGVRKVLVCGIETHVCVAQTVFDLMADGWGVYVAVEAVGSRFELDHRTALSRMDSAGATLTTTEAALFELCRTAEIAQFKQISRLAKEAGPERG